MKTEICDGSKLELAGRIIREGGLVAFPTETVYGLGADAFNEEAVKSIFIAKGRPQDNPLICHIANVAEADRLAKDIPPVAYKLWQMFSPGPLTLVLHKQEALPLTTTGGLQTVGVRIPNNPLALGLITAAGCPIAAPSANTSGRISPTEAQHVYEDMNGKIPLILDGGKSYVGIESTVLDLTKDIPIILRPGAITEDMLAPVLGVVKTHKGAVKIAEAPGMKYKHYAPVCPCVGAQSAQHALAEYDRVSALGYKAVIVAGEQMLAKIDGKREKISLGATPTSAMSALFSSLRYAEKHYDYIICESFEDEKYFSVQNRINKSIGGIIV